MQITGRLHDSCPNGRSCPRIRDTDGKDVIVQGVTVTDPDVLAKSTPTCPLTSPP